MSAASSPQANRRRGSNDPNRRGHIACNVCRRRRTRCDGVAPLPCPFCVARGETCEYVENEKVIRVPQSVFTRIMAGQSTSSPTPAHYSSDDDDVHSSLPENMPPSVIRDASGQHKYRGEGSSINWALLCQDVVNPRSKNLDRELQMENPTYNDPAWMRRESNPSKPELPPYNTARRLYKAQYLYIGTIFSFCRPSDFETRLDWVYFEDPDLSHREARLAYCQILLILAYGLMYDLNKWSTNDGPPGFVYFKKALEFLPDIHEEGSILFCEVLSLVGYYLQNLNRRDAAFLYIGLALRMALSLGMHQEVSDSSMNDIEREHRRRVWWSVYSMDRILCIKSGNPVTISDEDIDVEYPSPLAGMDLSPSPARVLSHYSQLSKILGEIGEGIYRKKRKSGSRLVASVHSIMSDLKTWYSNLPQELELNFQKLDAPLSREAVSAHLHYWQCVNMTARPLLFHVIQRRLQANAEGTATEDWRDGLSKSTVRVIEGSIAAARDSAKTLLEAARQDLVATYGFMDGEHAFSAALVLVMVNVAFPRNPRDAKAMESALTVLRKMAERGNAHIQARRSLLLDILSSTGFYDYNDSIFDGGLALPIRESIFATNFQQTTAVPDAGPPLQPLNEDIALENVPFDFNPADDVSVWNDVSMDLDTWLETTRQF